MFQLRLGNVDVYGTGAGISGTGTFPAIITRWEAREFWGSHVRTRENSNG